MTANIVFVSIRKRTVEILNSFHGLLCQTDVTIKFNGNCYGRKEDETIEKEIEQLWREKCSKNERLFSGSKFRLFASEIRDGKLELLLGMTCYRDLCGTNLSDKVDEYMKRGEQNYNNKYSYLSQTLGKFAG